MTIEVQPSSARERPRLMAGIVAVAFFMQMLDGTIIATSLPAMARDFGTDELSLNVGFTAYLLAMAVCIPPAGWLAGRLGARNVFLAATILFTLASLACALAQDLESFVLARIVQGAAGALMTPVGRQIVLRNTPKSELVHAIALITWPALVAPLIGPVLGGLITTHFGWRWNFLLNLPIGMVGAVLTVVFLRGNDREAPRRFDWVGFALTAAALSSVLIGLELITYGTRSSLAAALLVGGAGLGGLALRHLRRAKAPLLDLSVLRIQTFALSTLGAGTFARTAINATPFLLPLLFQVGYGFDAVATGSLLLVYFAGNLSMKIVTTPALRLFGFRKLLIVNGLVSSALVAAFAAIDGGTPFFAVTALLFAAGLTRSMQFTALNTIAFADLEPTDRGAATTLSAMSQQLSQLLAVAGSVLFVRLSQALGSGGLEAGAQARDFSAAFVAMGCIGAASSLAFLALPPNAGAEVSRGRP